MRAALVRAAIRGALATIIVALAGGCAPLASGPRPMDPVGLTSAIESLVGEARAEGNVVEFSFEGVPVLCIHDAVHDRMRLVVPIARLEGAPPALLEVLLTANFHTTLDARYAVSEGVVHAAYLHPLSTLTAAQLESAIRQVVALARNYGTTYSSDALTFGAPPGEEI